MTDVFTSAYLAGTPASLAPHARRRRVGLGAGERGGAARALPAETIALGGQLVTPDTAMRGWLTIHDGLVADISTRKPAAARTLATDGIILPGLIDLHGHPEFNVFAPWEPPRWYVNRYSWRASEAYRLLIRDPQNRLLTALPRGTELRYAEIRALVGGVTAFQGASAASQGPVESLVRNVDGVVFGRHRARSMIDLPSGPGSRGVEDLARIVGAIAAGDVDAFYVHLAEGRRDNARSVEEFDRLVDLGGLTPATVIIHGTALTHDQLGTAAQAGAALVWSPQSNLRLYGETTRAADALDVGLPVALGADWLPSGSTSLLAEMKVAREELAGQGRPVSAHELVAMVTSTAARISGLADRLGTLEVGRPADLVVLRRCDPDPFESVCAAIPNDVELVLVGGGVAYGRTDWVRALAQVPDDPRLEPVLAWGRSMLLDTSDAGHGPQGEPGPRLAQLRDDLTGQYPPVGPIWA